MTDDETKQDMTLSEYWVPPDPYVHVPGNFKMVNIEEPVATDLESTLSEYWEPSPLKISLKDFPGEFMAEVTSSSFYNPDSKHEFWTTSETYYRSVTSMVKEFTHKPAGTDLWIDLIWEEAQELFEAYDRFNYENSYALGSGNMASVGVRTDLLKEMADLVYVVHGLANELGWDLDEAIQRVHKSNMSKLDDNGQPIYREDGKRMKSKNYKPPYLEDLVK